MNRQSAPMTQKQSRVYASNYMIIRIVHASHGKFHHHDLARQLASRGVLQTYFTGYPRWKLRHEDLPHERISTFPWVETPYMALMKASLLRGRAKRQVEWLLHESFDRHIARHMPECEAFIGLSCAGLYAGKSAQRKGAIYVCDRGSSHIVVQDRLLREEYQRQGMEHEGIDPRVMAKEQAEYAQADLITVPSEFVRQTFIDEGVPPEKIAKIPYGVDLQRFKKVGAPATDRFEVVFVGNVSVRKGVPDLLRAFQKLKHPDKQLSIVGGMTREMAQWLQIHGMSDRVQFLGHCPQPQLKDILSRAQVMVLPSIEEGLALVMAQALACGCPVIASEHTGARDLFTHGVEGFIVPIRSPAHVTQYLQQLADDGTLRERMSHSALQLVHRQCHGWSDYGDNMVNIITNAIYSKRERSVQAKNSLDRHT